MTCRRGQHPSGGTGHVLRGAMHEEAEAEPDGRGQVCLQHLSDWLLPLFVLLRHELRERQGGRGDGAVRRVR